MKTTHLDQKKYYGVNLLIRNNSYMLHGRQMSSVQSGTEHFSSVTPITLSHNPI